MAHHLSNEVLLNIENLTKKFGETLILDNISLEIKKGEVCAILGPSGCGKSTFLRCINGLENINGGKIYFKGEDITLVEWRKIRENSFNWIQFT